MSDILAGLDHEILSIFDTAKLVAEYGSKEWLILIYSGKKANAKYTVCLSVNDTDFPKCKDYEKYVDMIEDLRKLIELFGKFGVEFNDLILHKRLR